MIRTLCSVGLSQAFGVLAVLSLWVKPLYGQDLKPSQIFEKVKKAIVVIKVKDKLGNEISQGSGVVLPSGNIATNFHVIKGGSSFSVSHGNKTARAKPVFVDPKKDVCLLKVLESKFSTTALGRTSSLKVGDPVYAVGSPQGLELSLSSGIVSQLRGKSPPLIQTTAPISPGSSGGGLFDASARLVGITTFYIQGGQGLNFALPIEYFSSLEPKGQDAIKFLPEATRPNAEWLANAEQLLAKGDWLQLATWGKEWIEIDAENPLAPFYLTHALIQLRKFKDALSPCIKLVELDSSQVEGYLNLGIIYNALNRPSDAIDIQRRALPLFPKNPSIWYNLGVSYKIQKKTEYAINAFKQSIEFDFGNTMAYIQIANTYRLNKNNTEASLWLFKAYVSGPSTYHDWGAIMEEFRYLNEPDLSIDMYGKMLSTHPEHKNKLLLELSRSYRLLNKIPEAESSLMAFIDSEPENLGGWRDLGSLHLLMNRHMKAIETYKFILGRSPAETIAHSFIGRSHLKLFQFEEAEKEYQLIPTYKRTAYSVSELAITYFMLGKTQKMNDTLDELRKIDQIKADATTRFIEQLTMVDNEHKKELIERIPRY